VKRLDEFGGDLSKFTSSRCIRRAAPDRRRQDRAGRREQPGHLGAGRQDRHPQAGAFFGQNDPDAYSYSGGLNRTTQGVLEFVEMFKAPIKMLHPLLTATQDGTYVGTENVGALPYQGIILAHSNESRMASFKNNRTTRRSSTASASSRCPTACACRRAKIYEKLLRQRPGRGAVRAGHARHAGALLGADAPEGARELEPLFQDAGL
jgi:serine protein kinase